MKRICHEHCTSWPRELTKPNVDDTISNESADTRKPRKGTSSISAELSASDSGLMVTQAVRRRGPSDSGSGSFLDLEVESGHRPDPKKKLTIAEDAKTSGSHRVQPSKKPDAAAPTLTRITPEQLNSLPKLSLKSGRNLRIVAIVLALVALAGVLGFLLARLTGG